MSIKSNGGVFGRNPTFSSVSVDGDISIDGQLIVAGEVITGLDYQGGWNASTNNPDIAASSPVSGQFWIVTADGSTDVGGITNWTVGDWALFDGTSWQRVEGGNTDLDTGVSGTLKILNGGTGANDAATARTNLGLGTAATTDSTAYATAAQGTLADSAVQPADISNMLETSDIGVTVQAYDSSILTTSDIDVYVQGYDANTAYLDTTQSWTATQTIPTINTTDINSATGNDVINISDYGYVGIRTAGVDSLCIKANSTTQFELGGGAAGYDGRILMYDRSGSPGYKSAYFHGSKFGFFINSSGEIASVTSNGIQMASGKGIDFSATGDAGGMTSELLDDYEEGTWTPILASGTCSGSAYYTKIGRLVNVSGEINHTGDGSGVIGVSITNLPFITSQQTLSAAFWYGIGLDSGDTICYAYCGASSNTIIFLSGPTSGGSGVDASRWLSGALLRFNLTYIS